MEKSLSVWASPLFFGRWGHEALNCPFIVGLLCLFDNGQGSSKVDTVFIDDMRSLRTVCDSDSTYMLKHSVQPAQKLATRQISKHNLHTPDYPS